MIQIVSTERVISCVVFISKADNLNKQVWAECHTINFLLTLLARLVLRNIGPLSFLHGPRRTRSVYCHDPGPIFRANISRNIGPILKYLAANK